MNAAAAKLPVLLTASVSTRGMKGADFTDAEREAMYLATLAHYLGALEGSVPLVFAENSGWDLGAFRGRLRERVGAAADRVEFIAVDPSIGDQSRGKGYNEILLMNDAVGRSSAIAAAGAFLKVTGRYPVYNLPDYLAAAGRHFAAGGAYYGDIKDHRVFDVLFPHNTKKWNGHAAYTVVFATTLGFYDRYLRDSWRDCNDYTDDWIENVWFRILKPFRGRRESGVVLRFAREPVCGGLQGSSAQTFAFSKSNTSFKARLARLVGNAIRLFTPWFWF